MTSALKYGPLSLLALLLTDFQYRAAIPGDEQGVDDQAERQRVHHLRNGEVIQRHAGAVRVNVLRRRQQGIVVGRDVLCGGVVELNAISAKAICGAGADVLIGGEQIHGRVVGRGVPASAVALPDLHTLHALVVGGGEEQGAGEPADSCMQAGVRVDVPGKRLHDGLFVAHNPSFDPLRQPGTALGGAALFLGKLGAERTVNVFRLVLECVDIQRLVSFPGQQKSQSEKRKIPVRLNRPIFNYRSWLR